MFAASVAACAQDGEPPFDDVDVVGREENPDGVPYPSDDLGGRPRDSTGPGARIPNFSFRGYPDSIVSGGLQVVSLADAFDPEQRRNKVLYLVAAVAWCPHCAAITQAMTAAAPELRSEGCVMLQTLMEPAHPSDAMRLSDLGGWVDRFRTDFTIVFDVQGRRLGSVADLSEVPWEAVVDTRSMEILAIERGGPEDLKATIRQALDWVSQNPARP
jgi:hypothetical protein